MGCFLSRCTRNTPNLETSSPVTPIRSVGIAGPVAPIRSVEIAGPVAPMRSVEIAEPVAPIRSGAEFADRRHRHANVIMYCRRSLGTQIAENAIEDRALNLGPVGDQNSEEGSLSSTAGTAGRFSEPAAGDQNSEEGSLRTTAGTAGSFSEPAAGDQNLEEGSLNTTAGTAGSFSEPAADSVARSGLSQLDRRPADLGDTSSVDVLPIRDHGMLWEILSERPGWEREVNEGSRGITEGFVRYQSPLLKTKKQLLLPSAFRLPWPELYEASSDKLSSFVEMVNKCTGSKIFELRTPKPDGRRPSVFSISIPAILQSSSAEAAPAETKLFIPAVQSKLIRNSEDLQRGEESKQTSEVPPSGLFTNVPKPDGRPPPVRSKQSIFQPSLAKGIRTGQSPETRLFTSDEMSEISDDSIPKVREYRRAYSL